MLFALVTVNCLLTIHDVLSLNTPGHRIVRGVKIPIEDAPWQVALSLDPHSPSTGIYCGGCILSENYILTAAHCSKGINKTAISVLSGTASLKGSNWNKISEIVEHPRYIKSGKMIYNNIAILKLASPLKLSSSQAAVTLRMKEAVPGETATVTGWGQFSNDNTTKTSDLQKAENTIITPHICQIGVKHPLPHSLICAAGPDEGICRGDLGGPLTIGGKQVGIVSSVVKCRLTPGFYTSVALFHDFINENTNDEAKWA